ncbi:MAG: CoA transferase [Deltaproteobacteria bacterium]|jgi:alpha-methylacyl-CoA racemase|nr:CoA transferase [Deltaproteobacteria bacterium]
MGPLTGVRVLEIAALGPAPFAAMMLSDMGAEVLRIDRAERVEGGEHGAPPPLDFLARGRRSAGLDLKRSEGVELLLRLVESADVILEGFRPGVMERLGVGPEACLARNPRIIFGRMTGWGQQGPLAQVAGHDINYIALAGALEPIGRRGEKPLPPLNLVGDFGGGGMLLAYGIACALIERERSGEGQVVDAAMVDGAATLMTFFHAAQQAGWWKPERGTNLLDGGAPFYDTYETSDGKYISIGALESKFYAELIEKLGLASEDLPEQMDRSRWSEQRERFAELIKTRTRDVWCEILEGTDACFAPVLSLEEASEHPHLRERGTFVEVAGALQPGPAPRFSRTPCRIASPPPHAGQHTDEALADWGVPADEIARLRGSKVIA